MKSLSMQVRMSENQILMWTEGAGDPIQSLFGMYYDYITDEEMCDPEDLTEQDKRFGEEARLAIEAEDAGETASVSVEFATHFLEHESLIDGSFGEEAIMLAYLIQEEIEEQTNNKIKLNKSTLADAFKGLSNFKIP